MYENVLIRKYTPSDIEHMVNIWNEVVEDGIAFPQLDFLDSVTGKEFFEEQSYCGVAERSDTGEILGLYQKDFL